MIYRKRRTCERVCLCPENFAPSIEITGKIHRANHDTDRNTTRRVKLRKCQALFISLNKVCISKRQTHSSCSRNPCLTSSVFPVAHQQHLHRLLLPRFHRQSLPLAQTGRDLSVLHPPLRLIGRNRRPKGSCCHP